MRCSFTAFSACVIFFILIALQQQWAELFPSTLFCAQLMCYIALFCAWSMQAYWVYLTIFVLYLTKIDSCVPST